MNNWWYLYLQIALFIFVFQLTWSLVNVRRDIKNIKKRDVPVVGVVLSIFVLNGLYAIFWIVTLPVTLATKFVLSGDKEE